MAYSRNNKYRYNYSNYTPKEASDLFSEVSIHPEDRIHLHHYISEEVKFYNNILEVFNAMIKREPTFFKNLKQSWEELFFVCCEIKFDVSTLRNAKEDHPLPEKLEKFRKLLLEKDENNKRHLTEKMIIFLENARKAGNIIPKIRYNISYELLQFFKDQAKIATEDIKSSNTSLFTYKKYFTTLEKVDTSRKYHVQIPREFVKCKFNESKKQLEIFTPYNKYPIVIENMRFYNEKKWDILILSKIPSYSINDRTEWNITFKNTKYKYLLKLLEVTNPYIGSNLFRQGLPRVY